VITLTPTRNLNLVPFGMRAVRRTLVLLTGLLVLFILPDNAVQAHMTCDVQTGKPDEFGCRPVPEYYIDNQRALMRLIEEIGKRQQEARAGGPAYKDPPPLISGTQGNYGYRCPDARGYCPNVWIPDPAGTEGLSSPDKYSGSVGFSKTNTYTQRINGAGIGVQSIVDQKPIDAVDIWGEGAQGGGEVCFYGSGRMIFLDASTSPRTQSSLETTMKGDHTCATIPGPGSVVFLPPVSVG